VYVVCSVLKPHMYTRKGGYDGMIDVLHRVYPLVKLQ